MSPTPDSTLADPEKIIANLRRELDKCRAELDKAQRKLDERTTERDEASARETAIAEVLQVVNTLPGELAPVFDAILEKAHDFCGADHGSMFLYDGERFRAVASHRLTEGFAATMQQGTAPDSAIGQPLIAGEPFVHIHDSALVEHPNYRGLDVIGSHRTLLSVPLRKGEALLGMILAGRFEVRPFTDSKSCCCRTSPRKRSSQ